MPSSLVVGRLLSTYSFGNGNKCCRYNGKHPYFKIIICDILDKSSFNIPETWFHIRNPVKDIGVNLHLSYFCYSVLPESIGK